MPHWALPKYAQMWQVSVLSLLLFISKRLKSFQRKLIKIKIFNLKLASRKSIEFNWFESILLIQQFQPPSLKQPLKVTVWLWTRTWIHLYSCLGTMSTATTVRVKGNKQTCHINVAKYNLATISWPKQLHLEGSRLIQLRLSIWEPTEWTVWRRRPFTEQFLQCWRLKKVAPNRTIGIGWSNSRFRCFN